ncbi:uncharacterized protein LOC116203203 [Punica granatum]|uniref:Uncharacterized protein LOC116203203 n=1 Tax=Punica granatum TaxID=22663 RepID=A0A6P8DH40_PUNGR|nr:uncharacterized protein LOC116203203 [Punica granatum]
MESPNSDLQGPEEELSSSESGWTMYIASPMEEDVEDAEEEEEEEEAESIELSWARGKDKFIRRDSSEEESDDSMASDASSGKLHHHHHPKSDKKHKEDQKWSFSKKPDDKDKRKGRGRAPKH